MKELSIEQKAQRYDEAIRKAKITLGCCDSASIITEHTIYDIFPELKESEDERIREKLIDTFNFYDPAMNSPFLLGIHKKDILAWLEKQKSVGEIVERCKTSWYNEGKIQGQIEGLSDEEKYQQGWHDALENQGEQKPADKVESKDYSSIDPHFFKPADKDEINFYEGDWVVYKNDVCQIVKREDGCNKLVTNFGIEKELVNERNLSTARLWTIEDAKNGDILYSPTHHLIWIYKDKDKHYAAINLNYADGISFDGDIVIPSDVQPATKEQRDLLSQKMEEAGYRWNANKKELKKIEQKSAWSEEDEMFVHGLIRGLSAKRDIHGHTTFSSDCIDITETINWLKSLKDKYAWKPSDEQVKALEHFVRSIGESGYASPYENNTKLLYSLLNDLKKLKE